MTGVAADDNGDADTDDDEQEVEQLGFRLKLFDEENVEPNDLCTCVLNTDR